MASKKTKTKPNSKQIYALKAKGLTNSEISKRLGVATSTVSYWMKKQQRKAPRAENIPVATEPQLMALIGSPKQIAKALSELGQ